MMEHAHPTPTGVPINCIADGMEVSETEVVPKAIVEPSFLTLKV